MCEPKRRAAQEKEVGVQFGYRAYRRFYEISQPNSKPKTYQEFTRSNYYTAFVKFGRHIKMTSAVKPEGFIDWVIHQRKPVDHWCRDTIYAEWLAHVLRTENAEDALDRAIRLMVKWGDEHDAPWQHWFRHAGDGKVCIAIANGRVSPWILYNCDEGMTWLADLGEENLGLIFEVIDPDFWTRHLEDYREQASWLKTSLKEVGL